MYTDRHHLVFKCTSTAIIFFYFSLILKRIKKYILAFFYVISSFNMVLMKCVPRHKVIFTIYINTKLVTIHTMHIQSNGPNICTNSNDCTSTFILAEIDDIIKPKNIQFRKERHFNRIIKICASFDCGSQSC